MSEPTSPASDPTGSARLPLSQLLRLSIYWLGLIAVFQGIGLIMQERIKDLVPDAAVQYTTLGIVQAAGVLIAIIVQPTVGSISDYTISRFGRRKPYILIGTSLDLVFLIAIANSNVLIAVAVLVVLLQFSSNFAQGPFQGYVPDLVPAAQVGLASGMVGLFTVLGVVVGSAMASLGLWLGDFRLPTIALGVIEFVTMASLFYRLDEGRHAKPRDGRRWRDIAAETWGTDILRERSFVYLVASRFFILGGSAFLVVLAVPYLERALGIVDADERGIWILAITVIAATCTAIATIPAARLSQRFGRKRVIYTAVTIGAIGMTICAFAPSVWVLTVGASLVGIGGGSFLAVDWALMTDIIPKASSGRYMGISNVATATNGVVATIVGGIVIDTMVRLGTPEMGPRFAFLLAPLWFAAGAWLLRPVDERRREDEPPASVAVVAPVAGASVSG